MMDERELAQKILSWIERTEQENTQEDISLESVAGRLVVLVNDIENLCKEYRSEIVVSGHFPIMCDGTGLELVHIPANSSIQLPDMDALWQIAQAVAEGNPLHEYAGRYYCNYCDERQASIHLDEIISSMSIEEDYDNGMVKFARQFPHTSDCIVTKARELIEWRKAQPRIEVNIKKSGELAEDKLHAMIREMVAEALAKAPKPMFCALCGKHYDPISSGWCGRQGVEFCSQDHMEQWYRRRGLQV